ncbi:hypothetical protein QIH87_29665 [Bradyrhizobium elkanii]|uniref:hypothetical protein n=1 Tax=Bradyrhizobium elkanii TaxID=29448 RepID=UPI0027148C67|nr:hypothetical protein [Bradyrhizobium elkanii]WLB14513.1 hypothetical protein QIH87_29665 [Bradyrhizobium elkanii]
MATAIKGADRSLTFVIEFLRFVYGAKESGLVGYLCAATADLNAIITHAGSTLREQCDPRR